MTELPPGARAVVLTVSDRSAAGVRADRSGPELVAGLRRLGFDVEGAVVVPDERDQVAAAIRSAAGGGADVVITTGGTGLGPRDVTPEATRDVIDREVPGISELLRGSAYERVPTSVLSRGVAGTIGRTLVVNVAGSTGAVNDAIACLATILPHAVAQLRGGDH